MPFIHLAMVITLKRKSTILLIKYNPRIKKLVFSFQSSYNIIFSIAQPYYQVKTQ